MADVIVNNEGSMFRFELETPAAHSWVDEHVSIEDWQWIGDASFAVDSRYARDLAQGMLNAGLEVE